MKIIHIADLHLGKQMNDISLLEDQKYILEEILSVAETERAEAVLIAGDVYQRTSPQAEAMALFDRFVTRLAEAGKRVFVISGNHDSAQRISYFSSLVRDKGVYISEKFDGTMRKHTLEDRDGKINIWMLPFVRPAEVRRFFPEEKIVSYQDSIAAVMRNTFLNKKERNILLCHQFISGCETSESEERTVGGLDQVDISLFGGFDYVAMGHIHRPQRLGRDTARYAGSPLKYSFSEANHTKSVTVVDMREKGDLGIKTVPLHPLHDVRLIEGMIGEIAAMPYSEDYVWITVHDEIVPPDARVTLSVNFPNMLRFSVVNSRTKTDLDVLAKEDMKKKSVEELFRDFYRLQNNDQEPGEMHLKILAGVLKEIGGEFE